MFRVSYLVPLLALALPTATSVAGTYSTRVLSHSPLAYWRLNETSGTLADDAANNNNGTYVNGVTLNQAGAFVGDSDVSASFDGNNDRVTLGTLSASGSAMTIIAWIRPANFTNANARIIAKASSATEANTYWMLALDNSSGSQRFSFRVRTGGTTTTLVATSGTLATNTWYMLAAVYDGANMRLYLDSQPVGSVAKTGTLNTSGSVNTWIGQNPDSTNAFAGRIDDVTIFSTALTQAQVNELYVDSGRALVGHWAMNENTGQTTADSSGNNLTMTLGTTTSAEASDPTWTTSSKLGAAALTFDGTADSITAANNALMSFTSEITITAWIRTTTVAAGQRAILNKGTNYGFALDGLNLYFAFYNGSIIGFTTTSLNLKANVWYHVAATFHNSGDRVRIYVNGTLVQSYTTTSSPTTDTSAMTIGSSALGTYWNGTLDDVRLYNRELSAAQIAALGNMSLIGHWKLDETSGSTASDISGNANNGTLTGLSFTTDSVQGRDSTGLNFGNSDYIAVTDHASLRPTTGLTIAAWVKGNSWGSGSDADTILRKGTDNPNNYQLAIADGKIALMLDDSDTAGIRGNTTLATGQWHHVAATWDGSTVRIYLNGVLDMTPTARSGTIGTDTRPLYIGGRASSDYFDGIIDDVYFYNYALSAAEIRTLYGLLGHWKFDESSPATTAADSSGNGYTATLTGNSAWTTGRVDGAIVFDGNGDYATTVSTSFPPPTDGSISFWMKTTALAGTQRILAVTPDWEIRQAASGVVTFDINGDIRFETGALQAGKWYHLAAMFDDTNDKYALYINGVLHSSGTQTFTPQSAAALTFGTRSGTTEYFNGRLDDVRIYNRRLTLDEIAEQHSGAPPLGVHILKWNEVQ